MRAAVYTCYEWYVFRLGVGVWDSTFTLATKSLRLVWVSFVFLFGIYGDPFYEHISYLRYLFLVTFVNPSSSTSG